MRLNAERVIECNEACETESVNVVRVLVCHVHVGQIIVVRLNVDWVVMYNVHVRPIIIGSIISHVRPL